MSTEEFVESLEALSWLEKQDGKEKDIMEDPDAPVQYAKKRQPDRAASSIRRKEERLHARPKRPDWPPDQVIKLIVAITALIAAVHSLIK